MNTDLLQSDPAERRMRERMYKDIHSIKNWIQFWSIIMLLPYIFLVIAIIFGFVYAITSGLFPLE